MLLMQHPFFIKTTIKNYGRKKYQKTLIRGSKNSNIGKRLPSAESISLQKNFKSKYVWKEIKQKENKLHLKKFWKFEKKKPILILT